MKLSGRVVGVDPGDEQKVRVILNGEIIASLAASITADGSFEFPRVAQGTYILRVASKGAEREAFERPRAASDTIINVTNSDVTGIVITWRSRSQ